MKRFLVLICMVCLILAASADQQQFSPKVLMYHLVLDEPYSQYSGLFVRPSDFEDQVAVLADKHYEFLFAEEYQKMPMPSVVLTFDDGYKDNYTEMFPILKKYNAKATVFLVADYIDGANYLSRDQIREMSESGLVSFQSHTKTHRDLTGLDGAEVRTEFRYSKYAISAITGKPVTVLSYPQGQYTDTLLKLTKQYFSKAYITAERAGSKRGMPFTIPRLSVLRDCSLEEFGRLI